MLVILLWRIRDGPGRGGLKERGRLNNFLPLKRGGGAYLRGGLNRGFTVIINFKSQGPYLRFYRHYRR